MALTHTDATFPAPHIHWAMRNREPALAVCRELLRQELVWLNSHPKPKWRFAATYALQLIGYHEDAASHSLLIDALSHRRTAEQLFEERLVHNLAAILWATNRDDGQALRRLFFSELCCSFSRSAAMDALCVGHISGHIGAPELFEALGVQLASLVRSFTPCSPEQPTEAQDLALLVTSALVNLRASNWAPCIAKAYDCGLVRPGLFTRQQALTQIALPDPELLDWQGCAVDPLDLGNWAMFNPRTFRR